MCKLKRKEEYFISRRHKIRIQFLAVDCWRDAKKVITPFCPPNIKKRGRKARKSPRLKINSGRIRNLIQKAPITSTTGNNLACFH
jgi:hypothetical protein